jgi:hypothetical protein
MPDIRFSVRQNEPLALEGGEEVNLALYRAYPNVRYSISEVLPPDYSDADLNDPDSLLLAYDSEEDRFYTALPQTLEGVFPDPESGLHLYYEYTGDDSIEGVVIEWDADIRSREEVVDMLQGTVSNAVAYVHTSQQMFFAPSGSLYCHLVGCRPCPTSGFLRAFCEAIGCC